MYRPNLFPLVKMYPYQGRFTIQEKENFCEQMVREALIRKDIQDAVRGCALLCEYSLPLEFSESTVNIFFCDLLESYSEQPYPIGEGHNDGNLINKKNHFKYLEYINLAMTGLTYLAKNKDYKAIYELIYEGNYIAITYFIDLKTSKSFRRICKIIEDKCNRFNYPMKESDYFIQFIYHCIAGQIIKAKCILPLITSYNYCRFKHTLVYLYGRDFYETDIDWIKEHLKNALSENNYFITRELIYYCEHGLKVKGKTIIGNLGNNESQELLNYFYKLSILQGDFIFDEVGLTSLQSYILSLKCPNLLKKNSSSWQMQDETEKAQQVDILTVISMLFVCDSNWLAKNSDEYKEFVLFLSEIVRLLDRKKETIEICDLLRQHITTKWLPKGFTLNQDRSIRALERIGEGLGIANDIKDLWENFNSEHSEISLKTSV